MDYRAYVRKRVTLGFTPLFSLLAVSLFSLSSGPYHVPLREVLAVLLRRGSKDDRLVILGMRLPRIVAGILVGASMGVAGAVLQGYLRNPLATPFANELQLSAMVYWSFGNLARATWRENAIMAVAFAFVFVYFLIKRWDLNASTLGDEVAKSVGVNIERERLIGTLLAAFITSVTVAFVGVIGFIGLVAPHSMRLIAGGDYRSLIPLSALTGALLLVSADTIARLAVSPMNLPVGVITSFLGAPTFIYLLVKMEGEDD